ncbi:MAG: hypothetical protein WCV93_01450 [Candidatus Shapirobacteria bacterium]|jgi:hypothetical protein
MNTKVKFVDSSKARAEFFDILTAIYTKGEEFVVRKSGIPMIKMIPYGDKPNDFKRFSGIISEKEADRMTKLVKSGRKDGSSKKKYLANWGD